MPPQRNFDAPVGQGVGPFIARIAVVSAHPAPVDRVAAIAHELVQPLPQVDVFHRLFGCSAPTLGLPSGQPLGDSLEHVLAVQVQRQGAWPLQGLQSLNNGLQFHPVVGGTQGPPEQFFFGLSGDQEDTPPAGPGIALAGAVGVDLDRIQKSSCELRWLRLAMGTGAVEIPAGAFQAAPISLTPRTRLTATMK